MAAGVALLPLALSNLPLWGYPLAGLAIFVALKYWHLPVVESIRQAQTGLCLQVGQRQYPLPTPRRVLRAGPWTAIQTAKGWCYLFDDQTAQAGKPDSPRDPLPTNKEGQHQRAADLQQLRQWLWLHRQQ